MNSHDTTLKKALISIKKLKQLLQEKNKSCEPIAITGMSCRFPNANNCNEYWQLLCEGRNIISDIPDHRWNLLNETEEDSSRIEGHVYFGGYLENIESFDAYFFEISPREAICMDPQQRILMEVAYEALEDAGLTIEALAGSNTGVFTSLYASQFAYLQQLENEMDALYLPTGNAVSIAANRISYFYDLQGPSITLDTACSSSLVALHLACLNLQANLCDQALVGAVNINLLPSINTVLSKAKMLSPSGQCKTFAADADGYVQGEGAGFIVLKPLSKALKDHDRIYAVIAGSAINHDGKTNGLTAPNGLQQEKLIQSAYRAANLNPYQVSYVECHGTGTFLGDPIEIEALGEVIGKDRDRAHPCWIGSVKTNIGHLEPAAGIASIIKVALMLKHASIPVHLNISAPNPHIAFDKYNLYIPRQMETLVKYGDYRIAGISGFSFGGVNAHIVLRDLTEEELSHSFIQKNEQTELFTLSAKDTAALKALMKNWCDYLKNNMSVSLAQVCYNLHVRRSHYIKRLAIIVNSIEELYQSLSDLCEEPADIPATSFTNLNDENINKNPQINETILEKISLAELATRYINQHSINWAKYEVGRSYPQLNNMPLYPWQHKIYWPKLNKRQEKNITNSYPLLGKKINSPLNTYQFEFTFDNKIMPEIKDTFYILHAGYYVEMLAYAANHLYKQVEFTAREIKFLSPLLVPDNTIITVQLILERLDNDYFSFVFYSNKTSDTSWVQHATGILSKVIITDHMIESFSDISQRSVLNEKAESFYKRITSMGMPAGETIRWTKQYWVGRNEILCELREPKLSERNEQFRLKIHLGIIDGCIQSLFLMLPEHFTKPYVASSIEKIEFHGVKANHMYVYSTLNNIQENGEEIVGNWYLVDKNRKLVSKAEKVTLRQYNNTIQIDKLMKINSNHQFDASLPYQEYKQQIIHFLMQQTALIFSMPEKDIDINRPLSQLGMDSLMALALMRVIESNLNVTYSLPEIMLGPSINDITQFILSKNKKIQDINQNNPWIAYRQKQENAKYRLFCLPYGGAGASIYRDWQKMFPDTIEICPIQLPARETRFDEKPIHRLDSLIKILVENLHEEFDLPFAFFGHSFGSLVAFEMTRYLRKHRLPLPVHLFASAYPDPRIPSKSLDRLIIKLKSANLNLFDLDETSFGSLSEEQLNHLSIIFKDNGLFEYSDQRIDNGVMKILLPIFFGDMNIVKSYSYDDEPPLDLPVTVFLGTKDTWVTDEEHVGWAAHSKRQCEIHRIDGGHFFIKNPTHRIEIIHKISNLILFDHFLSTH